MRDDEVCEGWWYRTVYTSPARGVKPGDRPPLPVPEIVRTLCRYLGGSLWVCIDEVGDEVMRFAFELEEHVPNPNDDTHADAPAEPAAIVMLLDRALRALDARDWREGPAIRAELIAMVGELRPTHAPAEEVLRAIAAEVGLDPSDRIAIMQAVRRRSGSALRARELEEELVRDQLADRVNATNDELTAMRETLVVQEKTIDEVIAAFDGRGEQTRRPSPYGGTVVTEAGGAWFEAANELRRKLRPTCTTCRDSHRMTRDGREVPCTFCPLPCAQCRSGPYCATTPCACACHVNG